MKKTQPHNTQMTLAEMIAAVISHPDTPAQLRKAMHYGLSDVFNDLDDNDSVTDSPEYLSILLSRVAVEKGGAR